MLPQCTSTDLRRIVFQLIPFLGHFSTLHLNSFSLWYLKTTYTSTKTRGAVVFHSSSYSQLIPTFAFEFIFIFALVHIYRSTHGAVVFHLSSYFLFPLLVLHLLLKCTSTDPRVVQPFSIWVLVHFLLRLLLRATLFATESTFPRHSPVQQNNKKYSSTLQQNELLLPYYRYFEFYPTDLIQQWLQLVR